MMVVTLSGHLAKDAEVRQGENNDMVTFTVACNVYNAGVKYAVFKDCMCFIQKSDPTNQARVIEKLKKGTFVVVMAAYMTVREYKSRSGESVKKEQLRLRSLHDIVIPNNQANGIDDADEVPF